LIRGNDVKLPDRVTLHPNYPNPFNPTTTISYNLHQDSNVVVAIYNLLGQNVKTLVNENQVAGFHSITWDGKNDLGEGVSSGSYIIRIQTDDLSQSKKMLILK